MKFVQLGREVLPREIELRHHKAVIVGIKNDKFVVILKQDHTREIVRLEDVVLSDKVYNMDELKDESCEFFKIEEPAKPMNDFERFKEELRMETAKKMIQEMDHN